MSYTFITAARITMPRKGFEAWLDAPAAPAVENPAAMFAGWYWSDRAAAADWSDLPAATPRDLITARLADTETLTVLRHHDGALEAYLWTVGHSGAWELPARQLLLMLAGASRYKDDDTEDHVLFWEDAAGSLPTRDEDAVLALLAVGRGYARFTGKRPLGPLLARLEPVEEAFAELAESVEDDDDPQGATVHVDPAVLR